MRINHLNSSIPKFGLRMENGNVLRTNIKLMQKINPDKWSEEEIESITDNIRNLASDEYSIKFSYPYINDDRVMFDYVISKDEFCGSTDISNNSIIKSVTDAFTKLSKK